MKLEKLKINFLPDTLLFGSQEQKILKMKAFRSSIDSSDITYILASRIQGIEDIINHPASTFITDYLPSSEDICLLLNQKKSLIYNKAARLQMAKLSSLFEYEKQSLNNLISSTAYIHSEDVEIGEGTKIYSNVSIYKGVKIGKNCTVHAGTVIGADGFGYEQDVDGAWFKIAHLGGVIIGDNVEIGANSCIDRGTLGDTIIESGVKIDNLVHIAHNVLIKKNAMIIANSMIAGSVVIGEGAWIAPSSSIREGKKIGTKALVGLGSVVVKDVESEKIVMGNPAKERIKK